MKEIALTQGFVAHVDDDDYERLRGRRWHLLRGRNRIYAVHSEGPRTIYMHREIMNAPHGVQVDHLKYRCSEKIIDNRKANLRLASAAENSRSIVKQKRPTTSLFKGVYWNARQRHWQSNIKVGRKTRFLGLFKAEAYAALAYDLAAVKLFGDFALTNFPVPGSKNWLFGEEAA